MCVSDPEFPQKFIGHLDDDSPQRHHHTLDRIHPAGRGNPAANVTVSQLNNGSRCLSRTLGRTYCFPWTICDWLLWAADL
jgi:hypothetical protein